MNIIHKIEKAVAIGLAVVLILGIAMGCSEKRAPTEGVKINSAEIIHFRTIEDAANAARAYVNDSDFVVIDSMVGLRFKNYYYITLKSKYDSIRTICVANDPNLNPYDLYIVDGVRISD